MAFKFTLVSRVRLARFLAVAAASTSFLSLASNAAAAQSDSSAPRATQDNGYALVQLNGEPLSTYVKTKPAHGKKIDFSSSSVKAYRAQLSALRNDYKQWLRSVAPQAQVTGEFDISLNAVGVQLNGATLGQVANSALVTRASYQNLYYKNSTDPDLGVIQAGLAWNNGGGPANAGAGIKVAIVDSGIDFKHPCFSDAGYAAHTQLGDRRFTNNKVIAARVFNNKAGVAGLTPEAIDSHGTHVSGTVACNFQTAANVDGVAIPYGISGVAPRALLGNYNVFPGTVGNARSEDILNALEAAYADDFDVANMSLGGGAHGFKDLDTIAVDNLDQANMVVAVANGNEGPGYGTVGSPGSAARALSAGAASVGHSVIDLVKVGSATYAGVKGDFGAPPAGGLSAPLAVVTDAASPFGGLSTACSALTPNSLTGKIALISRGDCDFTVKTRNAQQAGAVGTLVVNRVAGDAFVMGQNGEPNQPTIPAFMVALEHRTALMASNGAATLFPALGTYAFDAAKNDIIADFTSWGPTDVDFRVKPDVVAPGVNILSSIPSAYCAAPPCFAFFNGTSMATPHLAGSAAFLRGLHPDWSAAEVRSAIVNTADRNVLKNPDASKVTDVNIAGAGRENLASAAAAAVALDPVSVSFGAVPSGSGQSRTIAVTLRNLSAATQTLSLSVNGGDSSVSFNLDKSALALGAGASATVNVTMSARQGAAFGHHQGWLEIRAGGNDVAHAALYTFVK